MADRHEDVLSTADDNIKDWVLRLRLEVALLPRDGYNSVMCAYPILEHLILGP